MKTAGNTGGGERIERGKHFVPYVRVVPLRRVGDTAIVPSDAPVQVINTPEGTMLQNIGVPANIPDADDDTKHPRRRVTDMMEGRQGERRQAGAGAARAAARTQSKGAPAKSNGHGDGTSTRGRVAGRYVAGKKSLKSFHQPSVWNVYKDVTTHKRGATAKEVAERLDMKPGTVSWALNKLSRKLKVISYVPAEQAAVS